jgi:hypothetical protein
MSRPKKNSNLDRPRTEGLPLVLLPSCISLGIGTTGKSQGTGMLFAQAHPRELWGKKGVGHGGH